MPTFACFELVLREVGWAAVILPHCQAHSIMRDVMEKRQTKNASTRNTVAPWEK